MKALESGAVLSSIAKAITSAAFSRPDLASGKAGALVFHSELYVRTGDDAYRIAANALIDELTDDLGTDHSFYLFEGISGIAWALNHVKRIDRTGAFRLSADCCDEVDTLLLDLAGTDSWPHHFELIAGLAGVGLYAIEHPSRNFGEVLYARVLRHLKALGEETAAGVTWRTQPRYIPRADTRKLYPDGYHNLGLAHGVPGVTGLLGKALRLGFSPERTSELLRGSVSWLLRNSLAGEELSFGYLAGETAPARTAWCYGDLSVAIGLIQAARGLCDDALLQAGLSLAMRTNDRSTNQAGVLDATLCHGSIGNAHIFKRLYQLTNRVEFRTASKRWLDYALAVNADQSDTEGAFFSYRLEDRSVKDHGYLMGLSGIGLVLADSIHGLSNNWDAPLLSNFQ